MLYKSYLIEKNTNLLDKNIFLFYGENTGLIDDFKNKLKIDNLKHENFKLNQEEVLKDKNKFLQDYYNISLFGEEKIFFISQVNDKILPIIEEILEKDIIQKIYLFAEILDKKSKIRNYFEKSNKCGIIPCYLDNELSIKKIIAESLKGFKGLSSININLILNSCSLDRIKLKNEIEKIKIFFSNKEIDTEKLEILLNARTNDDFNLIRDEALKGNKNKTNKLLGDTFFQTEKNIYYLSLMNQRLIKLNQINNIENNSSLEAKIEGLKPPIFWKDKPIFIEQLKKWDSNKIKKALNITYKIELDLKSNSTINKDILIKKLMVDICDMANS